MDSSEARQLLSDRGVNIEKDDSILTVLALHEKVLERPGFVSIEAMQTVLRGKGIRVGNDDPALTLMVLHGLLLRDAIKKRVSAKPDRAARLIPFLLFICIVIGLVGFMLLLFYFNARTPLVLSGVIGLLLGGVITIFGVVLVNKLDKNVDNQEK